MEHGKENNSRLASHLMNGSFAEPVSEHYKRLSKGHPKTPTNNGNGINRKNGIGNGNGSAVRYQISNNRNRDGKNTNDDFARRMHLVSKRAALTGKRKLWDTNDVVDNAAQSAVDVYEKSYHTTKSFLVHSFFSAKNVYFAAKDGVKKIEHHLLVPVRDVVILPAFSGVERAVDHTVNFLQSEEASGIASQSLEIVRQTPFVGEHILAPAMVTTAEVVKASWEIIKYPIPSRDNVRGAVNGIMEGTKWVMINSWKEIYFYTKLEWMRV